MLWLKLLGLVSLIMAGIISGKYLPVWRYRSLNNPVSEAKAPRSEDRILVFSPHPDDESIAVGGYICNSCQNGAIVRIILITDGNRQGLKEKRYAEFAEAAALLGISSGQLVFWEYHDGRVKVNANRLFKQIEEELDSFNPTIIIYPHPSDRHGDHSVSGCVLEAVLSSSPKRSNILAYRYLIHYWFFPQPRILAKDGLIIPPRRLMGINHQWQQYTLTFEVKEVKKSAVYKYRSQLRNPFLTLLLLGFIRQNELLEKWGSTSDLPDSCKT